MSETSLRAIVVEDERLQREELVELLLDNGVEVIGQAATANDAVALLESAKPDVVFLDIQLGRETGFDVLERTAVSCDVVFVTAYDVHAVRAFEINAVDYLLKPVREERLVATLQRLSTEPRQGQGLLATTSNPASSVEPTARLTPDDRIFVRAPDRWRFLAVRAITAIEAAGDFSRIRMDDGATLLLGQSLRDWEARLPRPMFARIHRSTIVNLERVERVEEWSNRAFNVYIDGNASPYRMSRRYAARLRQ